MAIDKDLIAKILASQEVADVGGNGIQRYYTDPVTGQRWYGALQNYGANGTGESSTVDRSNLEAAQWVGRDIPNPDGGKSAWFERYGLDGNLSAAGQYDNSWKDMLQAMLLAAPAVAGIVGAAAGGTGAGGGLQAGGLSEALGGATPVGGGTTAAAGGSAQAGGLMEALGGTSSVGGSGLQAGGLTEALGGATPVSGGMTNGAFLGEGISSGVGAWDSAAVKSAIGSGELGTAGSYFGQNLANGTATDTLGSMLKGASTASNAADVVNAGAKAANTGLNLGGVLGAAAGALSSKDQQQTSSRDPWAPAQPMLKGLIDQLPALQQQYAQQPFNDAQKAGYNNMAGLLDLVNRNAGGLLGGFQANASGANQFVRGQPRGLIGSSFSPTAEQWSPQSYGRFGG